jgi:hypothetical protein
LEEPQDVFVNEGEGKEYVQMGFREAARYFFFARPYGSLGAWNGVSEVEYKRAVLQANRAGNLTEGWADFDLKMGLNSTL